MSKHLNNFKVLGEIAIDTNYSRNRYLDSQKAFDNFSLDELVHTILNISCRKENLRLDKEHYKTM